MIIGNGLGFIFLKIIGLTDRCLVSITKQHGCANMYYSRNTRTSNSWMLIIRILYTEEAQQMLLQDRTHDYVIVLI